ncbi:putative leucine-rich repeat domain superfamily [Helianthus anomalus]
MAKSFHLFMLILLLHVLESALANEFSSLSHADECSLLFQFKENMSINKYASVDSCAYPKVASWKLNKSDGVRNCCLWDGVDCRFGHVIGLDLSSSFLSGPISSNNSLFNLIHLRTLNLADNDFGFSQIPSGVGQLSQLANLNLSDSFFCGEVPKQISHLRNLVSLDLSRNGLKMQSSDFQNLVQNSSETLRELFLSEVIIYSEIPAAFGNLTHLTALDLSGNEFTGRLPSLESLSDLTFLDLSENSFDRWKLPDWFGKLNKITYLGLRDVNLYGEIPPSFFNLTQVEIVVLSKNHLKGQLSSLLLNFQNLDTFGLDSNIGHKLSVDLNLFLSLKKLKYLYLGGNNITIPVRDNHTNETQPKLLGLGLASCNLKVFPEFLRFQHQLEKLYLDNNNIEGMIPGWMWNISKNSLNESHSPLAPWVSLQAIDLSNNMLCGEIPASICDMLALQLLDLSLNNFTGLIPPCLEKLSNSLVVLNLRANTLQGTIPNIFTNESKLKMIDLSENKLEGRVPRSLKHCHFLQMLDLGYNFIEDVFPFWLGGLSELEVLILRVNKFYGIIGISSKIKVNFPKLHIIDLSQNSFSGDLPHQYFQEWSAMKAMKETEVIGTYMETIMWRINWFSIQMTNKGVKMEYEKIINTFVAIDLSSNMFTGHIQGPITTLGGLKLLNLSNNELSGIIPLLIRNLIYLESLDLSSNKLSGMIPQDMVQLNFLEFLNVSNNSLTGPIPQGKQFNTFSNNSYIGNQALCGFPLSVKCGDSEESKPPKFSLEEDTNSDFPNGIDWVVILIGFVSGLVIGIVCGDHQTTRYCKWLLQRFRK